jgi:hypothetical protein
MAVYRLFFVGGDGHYTGVHEITVAEDEEAKKMPPNIAANGPWTFGNATAGSSSSLVLRTVGIDFGGRKTWAAMRDTRCPRWSAPVSWRALANSAASLRSRADGQCRPC